MTLPTDRAAQRQQMLQQAVALQQAGHLDEAERLYLRVLAEDPQEVNALQLLGLIDKRRGRHTQAIARMRAALAQRPDEHSILNNLGNTLRECGRLDEARACLQHAVQVNPGYVEAWNNLGNVFKDATEFAAAEHAYRHALHLRPDYADALNNLGGVLHKRGALTDAAALYGAALGARPDFAMAHYNLANALTDAGQLAQSIEHFRAAVRLQPDYVEAVNGLLRQLQTVCDWAEVPALSARLRELGVRSGKVFPFSFLAIDSSPAEQLACAQRWVERQYAPFLLQARQRPYAHPPRAPDQRLRIGYLSSDLHDHATAWLMAEVFELHARSDFEIHAFSLGPDDGGAMRARLRRAFDHFHELRGCSWTQVADCIHGQGIDILVDLKGYTKDTGSAVLALRPAPLQVNYLGYPGSMGADFVDYLIGDDIVTPAQDQPSYDEALALMPHSYQCNDRHRRIGPRPTRAECGLPDTALVLCCFNHTYKISAEQFALWCDILAALPDSVLWLLRSNPWAQANLCREAQARGVAAERLVFAENRPLEQHLARLQNADLFLDTRPYNAHTTASDALWAGVPLITWPGDTFASRVAASLLCAAGLPELVCTSATAYRELAIALGRDRPRLAALRQRLLDTRLQVPLFDSVRFTRDLESLYRQMWARHAAGQPPALLRAASSPAETGR